MSRRLENYVNRAGLDDLSEAEAITDYYDEYGPDYESEEEEDWDE